MSKQSMATSPDAFEPFVISPDDPLAPAHGVVVAWIEEATATLGAQNYYKDVELKSLASGQRLISATPQEAVQYIRAAVLQVGHWDRAADVLRNQASNDLQRMNAHHLPGWDKVWGKRRQAHAVISALMRRALPFEKWDLLSMLDWCAEARPLSSYFAPVGQITRALERYAAKTPLDAELLGAIERFAEQLRAANDKDLKRLGTSAQQLCTASESAVVVEDPAPAATLPAPSPAPAGTEAVLAPLKRHLQMACGDSSPGTSVIDPDRFVLRDDSPLVAEHRMLSEFFHETVGTPNYYDAKLAGFPAGRKLLGLKPDGRSKALVAAAERHVNALMSSVSDYTEPAMWQSRYATGPAAIQLFLAELDLSRDDLFDVLLYLSASKIHLAPAAKERVEELVSQVEQWTAQSPLTEGERYVLSLFRVSLVVGPALGSPPEGVARLTRLIGDGAAFFLVPGEVWSDRVNEEMAALAKAQQQNWSALLTHMLSATAARPSAKWLKMATALVAAVRADDIHKALERWLPLVSKGQSVRRIGHYAVDTRGAADVLNEENATCLRGLLWLIQLLPKPEDLTRQVTAVALSAYKKVPGVGPRAVKVGNAAVYMLSALGTTDAVGQLAMLKVRVKFGTAQKEIEKAFNIAAESLRLPRDQIEEMAVPSYGLEEVGLRREALGDYRAELAVDGSDAALKWFDAAGKELKSVPAKVKSEHAEDFKDLQQALKDVQAMLPAQRDRIDSLFLRQASWPIEIWRPRYLEHPLVGTIARRLIWNVDGEPAIFVDGEPTDVEGKPMAHGKTAEITIWHPVGRTIDEITAWRRRLEALGITQPFKQAHREVYLLTDAERNTRVYSNRFAAHILRQHQFNALCGARGWKNQLRLMVDAAYSPPHRLLPQWGLRAEFWVEGIGEDYGTDTNEAGVYLRLATDQVRFHRAASAENSAHAGGGGYTTLAGGPGAENVNEPIPLDQIPPLVLSEIMRDVDLFVGVASVGNDPTWQDGGPQGRFQTYWQHFSFGELSGTATTRKQVLERLVPRLKIADRCSFADRFLVVRGQKRTYKIHLGSGNILMEPNDQYLCIVPDSRARAKKDDLFLPFEGDNVLSIIISKALLLADDDKIKDPTIVTQIENR